MATQKELDQALSLQTEGKPVKNFAAEMYAQDEMNCNFCHTPKLALVDGNTKMGLWALMCEHHFLRYGVGLGLGKGQVILNPR